MYNMLFKKLASVDCNALHAGLSSTLDLSQAWKSCLWESA